MNLASRPVPPTSGTAHTTLSQTSVNVLPGSNVPCGHTSNQVNNMGKSGSGALMSLFGGGLTVPRRMTVHARAAQNNQHVTIHLNFVGTIGQGTFGQIERASLTVHSDANSEQTITKPSKTCGNASLQVAVKRVLQDPRYKNRELSIMQRLSNHPNVVRFYYYYYSTDPSTTRTHRNSMSPSFDLYLHLVLECFPESLCELIYRYLQRNAKLPTHMIKVFTYQMTKALAYLHSHQICHRDIKSSNLLVDESTLVLKVCDFGSAKEMVPGAANVSYISSRYYRAPELLFGAQLYTCAIDIWSCGCVLAEMLRQRCLFMGSDSVDQLVKVIRVLGTPSLEDVASMNPLYRSYSFPKILPCPVSLFFPQYTPSDLLELMQAMLVFNPSLRISPTNALSHSCFDELRNLGPNGLLPGGVRMPVHLFDPNPVIHATDNTSGPSNPPNSAQNWPDVRKTAETIAGSENRKKKGSASGKSHETEGDWSNRAPLVTDKTSCSTVPVTKQSDNESIVKLDDVVVLRRNSTKQYEDMSVCPRKLIELDPLVQPECTGTLSNGGANESRNVSSTLNQSVKFSVIPGSSEVSETDHYNELSA